jgi:hypothetical protein
MRYYSGNIEPEENTIFVFGSNPEGRHGAGSAKVAKEKFGAVYGIGVGLQGHSYALPTKDLRIPGTRSISEADIIKNIADLYKIARSMPEKNFKVAYRTKANEKSLNGYTGHEMLAMFTIYPVPNNIYFSEEWHEIFCQIRNYEGTYVNHSGGAIGSDTVWGELSGQYGVVSEHYWYGKRTENGNHEITEEEFEEGKEHVLEANKTLHRQPYKYMNLLARNYSQVKNADEIFAIGRFKNKVVDGGTGWAVQMAIDDGKIVNFYDQDKCVWGRYSDGKWERSDTPVLTKNFAGIGTRKLNDNGWMAIKDVVIKTFEH